MARGWGRTLRPWIAGLAGLLILAVIGRRVSWITILDLLASTRLPWLGAALVLAILGVSIRAFRLWLVLGRAAPFPAIWRSVCLGYFSSLFLPMGGGEVVKVAAMNRQTGLSLVRAGTAMTMDRLFDVATVLALAGSVAGHGLLQGLRAGPLLLLSLGAAMLLALLILLLVSGDSLRAWLLRWSSRHPGRHAWVQRFDDIHGQAAVLRRPGLAPGLVLLQACILAVDVTAAGCALRAFPFAQGLPAAAPLRLAFFVMLAFGLPLLPGGFGSHQAATILALAPFGIGTEKALAVSLAGEATHFAALILLGLAAILGSGLTPLRLFRGAKVLDSPHPPEAP